MKGIRVGQLKAGDIFQLPGSDDSWLVEAVCEDYVVANNLTNPEDHIWLTNEADLVFLEVERKDA